MRVFSRPLHTFFKPVALVLALGLMAGGCATRPPESDPAALAEYKARNDPMEPMNRGIHDFNQGLDTVLIKPLAQLYHAILPNFVEKRITNIFRNAAEPWTMVNDLLQGEPDRAGIAFKRFLTNSTVGLGGMFDIAKKQGVERHKEDFGQTLAVWGIGDGPYLVLPLLGPSNLRDAFGTGVDFFADPVVIARDEANVDGLSLIVTGTQALDARSRTLDLVDQIKSESIDYYATLRSAYRQDRAAEIRNGAPAEDEDMDEFFEDFEDFEGLNEPPAADDDKHAYMKLEF